MWTGSSERMRGGRASTGLIRSSFLLWLSSSIRSWFESGNLALRVPADLEVWRSYPSFLASLTACWANLSAACWPRAISFLASYRSAFYYAYFSWIACSLSRKICWEMLLLSRSMLSFRISSTSLFFTKSSLICSISSIGSLELYERRRLSWLLRYSTFSSLISLLLATTLVGIVHTISQIDSLLASFILSSEVFWWWSSR